MELTVTGEGGVVVNQVVPEGALLDAAKTLAGRITANAPLAVQESRNVASRALDS